jgi:hypothetical protein
MAVDAPSTPSKPKKAPSAVWKQDGLRRMAA